MIKKGTALLLICTILISLGACKKKGPDNAGGNQEYPVTINGVTIEEKPASVVVLSPSIAKIICDFGARSVLSGVPDDFEYDSADGEISTIGSGANPDIEKIIEIAPQIVITSRSFSVRDLSMFTDAGIKVVVIEGASNAAALKQLYWNVGVAVLGITEGSSRANEAFSSTYESFTNITNHLPVPRKSFLYIATADGLVATRDTLESSLLSLICTNVVDDSYEKYTVDPVVLQSLNPDVIFLASDIDKEAIRQSETFSGLTAMQNDNIIVLDHSSFANQSSGDMVDAVTATAIQLYPDTFEESFVFYTKMQSGSE